MSRTLKLIFLCCLFAGNSSSNDDDDSKDAEKMIDRLLQSKLGSAFMVRLPGCSGTLIAPDWILTAAHCYGSLQDSASKNENGDLTIDMTKESGWEFKTVEKPSAAKLEEDDLWTKSVSMTKDGGDGDEGEPDDGEGYWRKVEKIILHGKFENEAMSWKGFDFALLKLQTGKGSSTPKGAIAPICLASEDFDDFDPKHMYMSGYGRRYVPHCITDQHGPQPFDVCGRPQSCSKDHRTRKCGLQFLYDGKEHKECLKTETPSAKDPECVKLRKQIKDVADSDKILHVFDGKETFVTTCYPKKPASGKKGWCTTRSPGIDENSEPTYTSGWGFCSEDPSQKHCSESVPEKSNSTAMAVSILDEKYCKDKLEANLKVEQPETKRSDFEKLQSKHGVICIGQNYTHHFSKDLFFDKQDSYSRIKEPSESMLDILTKKGNVSRNAINGGPSCFGDSGGPLFKIVADEKKEKAVPVLTGVFSFMLWGTCQGAAEPGYYGRVIHALDWLNRYVPSKEICWYGKHLKASKYDKKRTSFRRLREE